MRDHAVSFGISITLILPLEFSLGLALSPGTGVGSMKQTHFLGPVRTGLDTQSSMIVYREIMVPPCLFRIQYPRARNGTVVRFELTMHRA